MRKSGGETEVDIDTCLVSSAADVVLRLVIEATTSRVGVRVRVDLMSGHLYKSRDPGFYEMWWDELREISKTPLNLTLLYWFIFTICRRSCYVSAPLKPLLMVKLLKHRRRLC